MVRTPTSNTTTSRILAKPKSNSKSKSLKSGRPPLLSSNSTPSTTSHPSISSKHTRTLIRTHHVLQKRLAAARLANDTPLINELESRLSATGGLQSYQLASTVGQSATRGGDSSRVLVHWLRSEIDTRKSLTSSTPTTPIPPLRILEVGALSTTNALNIPNITTVRRIDLRSSGPGIEEADFMTFPTPNDPDGKGIWQGQKGYDVLSLSLVLNYVPDARGRGAMLKRTTKFFSEFKSTSKTLLPAPTLHNSRYLTPEHLTTIMASLGYTHLHTKTTQKLHYSLWRYDRDKRVVWIKDGGQTTFAKKEINPGGGRNNFCIILDEDS
ncbi:25S rRNA (adenine2142-N1)-methyltransferase [Elasticomyces elasticus]|uniref:25S rRNA adenine-N(1) methyltransferase n=1 Tax=Exophiala sideris TaxID=1016849 RepID=A0ABR0J837_9EURO|nr:25S rRNA (adenine2142-N1)-methyltransferase [Elasticomyces elasticus]KAK5029516.1 25S rRNA (adenine2142-N1)-methyltransferase [Exophiala sideris]KAK5036787.1 25S rRNA (adenine2142-N1)-methyltransferase [Exophiala sideris]KAK5058145.1 25S rRNA (adenine2142-N1)-methyltransferase [Exophiala sideris]KAK5182105.1 25S rRNA (adenine2142-N1)-methyltransferase [Eurotiomycetes sp. CCFEE 6388]